MSEARITGKHQELTGMFGRRPKRKLLIVPKCPLCLKHTSLFMHWHVNKQIITENYTNLVTIMIHDNNAHMTLAAVHFLISWENTMVELITTNIDLRQESSLPGAPVPSRGSEVFASRTYILDKQCGKKTHA
jgi:hypothetical protein